MTPDVTQLPGKLAAMAQGALLPHEQVVWVGQPVPARYMLRRRSEVWIGCFTLLFMMVWGWGFTGWKLPDFRQAPAWLLLIPGLPVLVLAVWVWISPRLLARNAGRIAYVLTTHRALVLEMKIKSKTQAFELNRLQGVRRVDYRDGTGDLILHREWENDGDGGKRRIDHGFMAIAEVKEVAALARQWSFQQEEATQ